MKRGLVALTVAVVALLLVAAAGARRLPLRRAGRRPGRLHRPLPRRATRSRTTSAATEFKCGEYFKYAGLPGSGEHVNNARPTELGGVRGGLVFDVDDGRSTAAWELTTGRPDVTIAVLDSGIEWNDAGAMNDLRFKTRINRGEVPLPRTTTARRRRRRASTDCAGYTDAYDGNGDGVFNLRDYACDSRVNVTDPRRRRPGRDADARRTS